jgi:HSP20 family protein
MTLIRRPSPFAEVVSLREAMERFFDDRFTRPIWPPNGDRPVMPALDLFQTPEAIVAKIALPGVKPADFDVSIADDLVTITGTFSQEKETTEGGYVHKELSHGSFERSFSTPTAIKPEEVKATFKDGLLTLTLPKNEAVKPQHVKVDVA